MCSKQTLLALWLGAALGGPAVAASGITVENGLQTCVAVQPGERTEVQGVLLQQAEMTVSRPIGECGCKSALMGYTASVVLDGGAKSLLQTGVINTLKPGSRALPLATDAALVGDYPVVLSFSCAVPD